MSFTVDVALVQQFNENVHFLTQQKPAKFPGAVRMVRDITAKAYFFERVGPLDMVQITSRHQSTPLNSTPHSRRQLSFADWNVADLIDDIDVVKELINLQSTYVQNFAYSRNRRLDDTIIAAFNANAVSVANDMTTSNVALPSAQQIANGGTNFTLAKWRQAKQILDSADVPPEDRYIALSPIFIQALLGDSQITSADFNTVRALVKGEIDTYLGFKIIVTTRLPIASNIRSAFAWQKMGIGCGVLLDKGAEVTQRADLNNSTQVLYKLTLGATRIEEQLVVQIDGDETK